ncbi:hypothetical protein [Trichormus azollae]|uniref:hypothetical protein n=1 Tax=Trichormus azollae TaxID=1164 RepID=UPI00325D8231
MLAKRGVSHRERNEVYPFGKLREREDCAVLNTLREASYSMTVDLHIWDAPNLNLSMVNGNIKLM